MCCACGTTHSDRTRRWHPRTHGSPSTSPPTTKPPVIRDVKGDAENLEKIDPEIEVTVDDKASSQLVDSVVSSEVSLGGAVRRRSRVAGRVSLLTLRSSAQTLATLTGTSLENASRLQTVFGNIADVDANDLLDIILQMNDMLLDNPELAASSGSSSTRRNRPRRRSSKSSTR